MDVSKIKRKEHLLIERIASLMFGALEVKKDGTMRTGYGE
jgi:hypothetical protein